METDYHFSSANIERSRRFFDDIDTSSIASSSDAKIQELLNNLSLYSHSLKYSTDELDRYYISQYKSLKNLIRKHSPNLKAEKRANPPANEALAVELDAADELLKVCVTANERQTVCENIFKKVSLTDLISLAKAGHVPAQCFLGYHKSYAGKIWLEKAIANGNPNARYSASFTVYNEQFERAASLGHVGAKITLLYRNRWDKNDILEHLIDAYEKGNREDDLFKYFGKVSEDWEDYNSALKWYGQISDFKKKQACMHVIMNRPPWEES